MPAASVFLWPVKGEDLVPLAFWRRSLMVKLQLAGLLSLLLPVIGSLLNHHYAQVQPYHGHIYVGNIDATHDHGHFAQPHAHTSGERSPVAVSGTFSVPASGDWAPQTAPGPPIMLMAIPSILFHMGSSHYGRLIPYDLQSQDEVFFSPPEKPPRT